MRAAILDAIKPKKRARRRSRLTGTVFFQREILPWLFILPVLGLNLLVMLGPSVGSAYFAFTDWRGLGKANWVGLDNFVKMFDDQFLAIAFRNNLRWLLLSLFIPPFLALAVAALMAEISHGQRLLRAIFYLPLVVSTAVASRAWQGIYHPYYGVLPWLAGRGLDLLDIRLLGNPDLAFYLVFITSLWKGWGFPMVLFLAAMQQVPAAIYESATIDGANRLQQFVYITVPSVRPTLILMMVFALIGSMLVFDFVFIMTGGGPNHTTDVLALRMYLYAFDRFQAGYAAAIGVALTIWAAIVTTGFVTLRRLGWEV